MDDLSQRLGAVGDNWLSTSEKSPKYFEFTPLEMHAVCERLRLAEPTASGELLPSEICPTMFMWHHDYLLYEITL